MNEKTSVDSTMNNKKIWTVPVIEKIDINSAMHQNRIGRDSTLTRTAS